jgi:hypothetical protein
VARKAAKASAANKATKAAAARAAAGAAAEARRTKAGSSTVARKAAKAARAAAGATTSSTARRTKAGSSTVARKAASAAAAKAAAKADKETTLAFDSLALRAAAKAEVKPCVKAWFKTKKDGACLFRCFALLLHPEGDRDITADAERIRKDIEHYARTRWDRTATGKMSDAYRDHLPTRGWGTDEHIGQASSLYNKRIIVCNDHEEIVHDGNDAATDPDIWYLQNQGVPLVQTISDNSREFGIHYLFWSTKCANAHSVRMHRPPRRIRRVLRLTLQRTPDGPKTKNKDA